MKNTLVWIIGIFLLLAVITVATLVLSNHRVLVIEGVSGLPLSEAYVSIERSSGEVVEVGVTDEKGELDFWFNPLSQPRTLCAQHTFYGMGCVQAFSLKRQVIELAVP